MEKEHEAIIDKFVYLENDTKKLKCKDAFEAAKQLNVPVAKIGAYCNTNKIKIASCQLGCF